MRDLFSSLFPAILQTDAGRGAFKTVYNIEALEPAERIVIRHVSGPRFTLTVTFAAEEAGTRLTWRQSFDSASEYEAVRAFAAGANEENLDRLEALLREPA